MKDTATRTKILEATISSIELYGIEGCSVRNIAKEANVTLSSIHYYFESKDVLVDKALDMAISGSFKDAADLLRQNSSDIKTGLKLIFSYFLEGAIQYPGITRAGLQPLLMQGNADCLFTKKLNAFLVSIMPQINEQTGLGEETIQLRLIAAFSSLFFIGIAPIAFEEFSSITFKNEKVRDAFVGRISEAFFR